MNIDDSDEFPKRVLAIDLGEKRVGLAISDPFGNFPVGLETYTRSGKSNDGSDIIAHLASVFSRYDIGTIAIGMPINMDGTEGFKAQESRAFAAFLAEIKPEYASCIILEDERLTSVIAQQQLRSSGVQSSRNKGLVDQSSAMILVETVLNKREAKKRQALFDAANTD